MLTKAIVAAVMAVAASTAAADDAFKNWFGSLVSAGSNGPDIAGIYVEYKVSRTPPGEQPSGMLLSRVWRSGQEFRISHDGTGGDGSATYSDKVWANGIQWSMTPKSLVLLDQADQQSPGQIHSSSSALSYDLQLLFTGGIGAAVGNRIPLEPRLEANGTWSVVGSADREHDQAKVRFQASGRWFASEGWGTIDRTTFTVDRPGHPRSGTRGQLSGWRRIPGTSLAIAETAIVSRLDGGTEAEYHVVRTDAYSAKEFKRLTAAPAVNDVDPIRGAVTFRTIVDNRGGRGRQTAIDPENRRQTLVVAGNDRHIARLRLAGWVLAVCIVAALLFLRLRARAVRTAEVD
jgi:hypothetical protein